MLSRRAGCAGQAAPLITNVTGWLQEGCSAGLTGRQLYETQNLFSIYVHRSPGKEGSPEDSIFYKRDIPKRCAPAALRCSLRVRVATLALPLRFTTITVAGGIAHRRARSERTLRSDAAGRQRTDEVSVPGACGCRVQGVFAQPSLVLGHRLLLAEALKDNANAMFVLVSESCMPLYHPALFWAQLMSESHVSRMSDGMFGVHRWSPKMATTHFKPGHFRKGSQFSSLTRMHAQYVAYDQHVWTQFHAYCKTQVRCSVDAACATG